jgi:hypothetical protein
VLLQIMRMKSMFQWQNNVLKEGRINSWWLMIWPLDNRNNQYAQFFASFSLTYFPFFYLTKLLNYPIFPFLCLWKL